MKQFVAAIVFVAALYLSSAAYAAERRPMTRATVMPMPAMGNQPGGSLREIVSILSDLNFTPEFTLTVLQKEKIQAIREVYQKDMEKWQADHADEFKKLQEQMDGLRRGGAGAEAREKVAEVMKVKLTIYDGAPKDDEAVKQIKAVLTEEQLKKCEEKLAERMKTLQEAEIRLREMYERMAPAGGRGAGGGL